ncbi:MAG: 4-hydroxythreonine-4-phosphate dehydrogenase PdxA [Flavobacteriales bacterium]|nr:4-hydroxythreonine-4-phosphate dehydrogenase PdxA [Flavobacteriales bacterium]
MAEKLRVGISIGDINGIGMEVIIKTFLDNRMLEICTPIVYGSSKIASFYRRVLDIPDFSFNIIKKAEEFNPKRANLVNLWDEEIDIQPGESTSIGGEYAFKSLKTAVEDLASGKTDVLITAPINKQNIQSDEFNFTGHTEFLADYANVDNPLMVLCDEGLRVGLVTGHLPLKEVPSSLNKELILSKLAVFNKTLKQDFGIEKPKIAVLGLNPHSGDGGLLGTEEQEIISPAIKQAFDGGVLAMGPYPADGLFGSSTYQKFDGILAMYHDQGLAPFKAMAFHKGVNYTAGLPIVRTSPDHGVGYDIAGQNKASEQSFRQAVYLACDIYKTRRMNKQLFANSLDAPKEVLEEV